MAKQAIEQTGIIPRSIIRTFDRFRKQLFSGSEKLVIQEFRISRFQVLVSVKCLVSLTIIPLIVNYLLKNFLLIPVTENFWNRQQNEIFINSYQQDRAFDEIQKFEEKIYFEFLINDIDTNLVVLPTKEESVKKSVVSFIKANPLEGFNVNLFPLAQANFKMELPHSLLNTKENTNKNDVDSIVISAQQTQLSNNYNPEKLYSSQVVTNQFFNKNYNESTLFNKYNSKDDNLTSNIHEVKEKQLIPSKKLLQEDIQEKTIELAMHYNQESIIALTNLFGDFITFGVVSFLVIWMKPQIIILKSFLTESIYSLSDTTKSFLLILGTDLLVGFHSPRGWEICLELVLRHFGFPENQDFIYLFVATFPVLLDTVFKYWIFRYLNQISPSTVATYHSMIE
jgi:hypothetical protein